jgi:predicted nucleotidyltransferase
MMSSKLISTKTIKLLTRVFKEVSARWYMIGANAINMHLALMNEPAMRTTDDVDFAVYLNGYPEFEIIKQSLIDLDFSWSESLPYRFIRKSDSHILDIIPFGGISLENEMEFYDGKVKLSVKGLKEMMGETELVSVENSVRFHLASLDALSVLKLISWSERPEWRGKDREDFLYIMDHYFDLHSSEIFEKYNYLFHPESENTKLIGARVIGLKLKTILKNHNKLYSELCSIINGNIRDSDQWSKDYAVQFDTPADIAREILQTFRKAFIQ